MRLTRRKNTRTGKGGSTEQDPASDSTDTPRIPELIGRAQEQTKRERKRNLGLRFLEGLKEQRDARERKGAGDFRAQGRLRLKELKQQRHDIKRKQTKNRDGAAVRVQGGFLTGDKTKELRALNTPNTPKPTKLTSCQHTETLLTKAFLNLSLF